MAYVRVSYALHLFIICASGVSLNYILRLGCLSALMFISIARRVEHNYMYKNRDYSILHERSPALRLCDEIMFVGASKGSCFICMPHMIHLSEGIFSV